MKRLMTFLLAVTAVAFYGDTGENPFVGKSGRKLLDAIGREAAPQRSVTGIQRWMATTLTEGEDGLLWLPFDGEWVSVTPVWPDDVMPVAVIPQEWWKYMDVSPTLTTDLINYLPGRGDIKQRKSLYPPFEISVADWTNGVSAVGTLEIAGIEVNAWQPPREMRGDVARVLMYMLAVYGYSRLDPWAFLVADDSGMTPAGAAMMLRWSREDPVDEAELRRCKAAAMAQGGFGNPFVILPGLEEWVWGDKAGEPYLDGSKPDPEPDPTQRVALRGVYRISEPHIDLWSPEVSEDAVWSVDGRQKSGYVLPSELGVGSHEFAYADSHGERGRVKITIVP